MADIWTIKPQTHLKPSKNWAWSWSSCVSFKSFEFLLPLLYKKNCAVQWSSFKFYNGIDLESFIQTDRATIRGPSGPKKISGIGKGQGSSLTIFLSSFGYNLLYIALPITNSRVHTFNVSIIQVKDIGYSMLFVTGDVVCINTEDSIK